MGLDDFSKGLENAVVRTLSFTKGDERWIFCYVPGDESKIIDEIYRMAGDEQYDFDWFDAAVVSFNLGKYNSKDSP